MATATQQRQTSHGTELPAKSLVEQAIAQTVNEKVRQVDAYLTDDARLAEIEKLLPEFMKGQALRIVKRARLTFAGNERLQKCTPASFVKCVAQAAELGFAIDGRLCHAVPYNNKKKDADGREYWVEESQLQVDYKGMIAVAKRAKLVRDVWARRVCDGDTFAWHEQDGQTHYEHGFDQTKTRGNVVGVLAVATHEDGWYRAEWMHISEIHSIRARSKSFTGKGISPWTTDPGEMEKKTCIKRLLKTFSDDPGLIRLLELDDQDTDLDAVIEATERQQVTAAALRTKLAPRKVIEPESATDDLPETSYEPHTPPADSAAPAMTTVDQFRAEAMECDTARSVATLTDNWIGPGSARELTPEDVEQIQNAAAKRIGELKTTKGNQ